MSAIDRWTEEDRANITECIPNWARHVPAETAATDAKAYIAERRARVEHILADGLDIGSIARYVVPVKLELWPDHNWVFVAQGGSTKGRGYPVAAHIRR